MPLNSTVNANRIHIGFFGMINAGKSSVVNALFNQNISIVSNVKGTTTDPVSKATELLPLGPVIVFDTPGFDDCGALGKLRVEKTMQILRKTDTAILIVNAACGITDGDRKFVSLFEKFNIPYIIAYNKSDLLNRIPTCEKNEIYISAQTGYMIEELKEKIITVSAKNSKDKPIASDLAKKGDYVVLVIPIDESAPKGRLILPQVQTIRDLLDANAVVISVKPDELEQTISDLGKKIKLVICDSQVFEYVSKTIPNDIALTSFSVLMARFKGFLSYAVSGAHKIDTLNDGDTVLISEGCSHKRTCSDIGSVKLPNLLKKYTNKNLNIRLTSGNDFENDLKDVSLVIHCGGCMLNEREIKYRLNSALAQNVPFTNFGTAIAHMKGILNRSINMF